ncbi:MAG: GNAT family N-acetyltransferase [Bacteroidota bacterium]|nr:GNAT family N-acetyltransferase [Bacteroidota bacterium]MDP4274068.1 GNAT family N-acetyltransferase [Bacteroidota bacterium]
METLNYRRLSKQLLYEIKPLWEELNKIHLKDSIYFKDHYTSFNFDKRAAHWKDIPDENIYILVIETEEGILVGYCVSTIKGQSGEVDSLFLSMDYRGNGLGRQLLKKNIDWLKSRNCRTIRLSVSYGHENVVGFYKKMGLYPRLTVLEYKNSQ